MAASLWGKVYYSDLFAGELRQEPGGRCVFTYDAAYLAADHPSIAFTLPRRDAPHVCERGLHPFFDNLVAEGWLRMPRRARSKSIRRIVSPCFSPSVVIALGLLPSSTPRRLPSRRSLSVIRPQWLR